jgi:uncharacterized hydrophobic protein (TIGR00271 family)
MDPAPPPQETERQRRLTPIGAFFERGRTASRAWPEDRRRQLEEQVFFDDDHAWPYLWRFGVLIVLSTMIAAFGLVANSVAVVIGAMLIAPLMTPILATAAALMLGDLRELLRAVLILVGGTIGAIATAYLVTAIGLSDFTATTGLPSEILARTQPSLIDLGVAIAAGLAAGYVLTHPQAGSSLPGVAIAVALVPPLATVGITYQLGATEEAAGALLLYATNLFAIIVSAITVMLVSGYRPIDISIKGLRSARIGLVVSLAALIVVAVPLTLHTLDVVEDQQFGRTVANAVETWDPNAQIVSLEADRVSGTNATVDLVIATTSDPPPAWQLAEVLAIETGLTVDVSVRFRPEEQDDATAG